MVEAVAKKLTPRAAWCAPRRSVARSMALFSASSRVASGGASQSRAGRDVIRGAVEHLADAIAGQVDGPALDFELALAVLFDFHFTLSLGGLRRAALYRRAHEIAPFGPGAVVVSHVIKPNR